MRKNKQKKPEDVPTRKSFEDDKTGLLKNYAENLISLAEHTMNLNNGSGARSTVIAIDAPWGRGKTFFLEAWEKHLKEYCASDVQTYYLDAWDKDHIENAFTVLVGSLVEAKVVNNKTKKTKEAITTIGKNLPHAAGKIILNIISNKIGIDLKTLAKEIPERIEAGLLSSSIDSYKSYTKSIEVLRSSISKKTKSKRLFFFIDELDRCKPMFAIRLLEMIKHIFDAENIVFILGIHLDQLASSIKAVYGSEFDAKNYLERFIDYKFILPSNNNVIQHYCNDILGLLGDDVSKNIARYIHFIHILFAMETREEIKIIKQIFAFYSIYPDKFEYFNSSDLLILYIFFLGLKMKMPSMYKKIFLSKYASKGNKAGQADFTPMHIKELNELLRTENLSSKGVSPKEQNQFKILLNDLIYQFLLLFYDEESLSLDMVNEMTGPTSHTDERTAKKKTLAEKVYGGGNIIRSETHDGKQISYKVKKFINIPAKLQETIGFLANVE